MNATNKGYASTFFWREDEHGTQILLQKKDRGWKGADFWTPFGGLIEENEKELDCLVRELNHYALEVHRLLNGLKSKVATQG